ncbi:MAG: hypothetical protein WDO56_05515 [Gammaproteobacteria bacterium]
MRTYFTDFFNVKPTVLERYGAFDVSLVTDLPLFIDPFLLFNSKKAEYQALHEEMIRYLRFLRDKSLEGELSPHLVDSWYRFPEVKQNWLGFTLSGNRGSGLGRHFAVALSDNLGKIFANFGNEKITEGSHLEKLCLIRDRVGRDNISDFTTNLIKGFLCEYTETFAAKHLDESQIEAVAIPRASFNYETEVWEPRLYQLPWVNGDYVILTPKDMLTRDDVWINKEHLYRDFEDIPEAIENGSLRAQIENYFRKVLKRTPGKQPTQKDKAEAVHRTISEFPELIDFFIKYKEEHGDEASRISADKVRASEQLFIAQIRQLQAQLAQTEYYAIAPNTYEEAHRRLAYLKDIIENKDGYRIFYVNGKPLQREEDVHVMYRLVWVGSPSDPGREADDGRGPADFKISRGAHDKTIVEFKLAKNKSLEKNLANQAELYQKASDAKHAIKAIVYFNDTELTRVHRILKRLKLTGHRDVVLIDADASSKPSASKAGRRGR